jgi:hypothetical protein
LKDLGVEGSNNKMVFKEIGWAGVDWIHLAQNRDKWQDLLGTVVRFMFFT